MHKELWVKTFEQDDDGQGLILVKVLVKYYRYSFPGATDSHLPQSSNKKKQQLNYTPRFLLVHQ